jgi:hypothetical protein
LGPATVNGKLTIFLDFNASTFPRKIPVSLSLPLKIHSPVRGGMNIMQKYFFVLHLKRESKTTINDVNIFSAEVCRTQQGAAKPAPGNAVGWS